MSIFSKAKVKSAISTSSRIDLNHRHITTADFMQLNCAFIRHLVPRQSIDVDFNTFARLEALPVPTFGDCTIKHHAFFVPYRTIMPGWNDFITDTPHAVGTPGSDGGLITRAACFTSKALTRAIVSNTHRAQRVTSSERYHICVSWQYDAQNPYRYYRFTDEGRQIVKILNQLGYRLDVECNDDATEVYISALPLLAFCKVYLDWYYPSSYVNDLDYRRYQALLQYDTITPVYSVGDIDRLLDLITFVNFDADYFTSAFDNPAGPNPGLFDASLSVEDSSYTGSSNHSHVVTASNGTPVAVNTDTSNGVVYRLSDFVVESLHRLTDYMKRHQLVGSRSLERYLSRFGITLNADKMNRSYMLGHYQQAVNFGAVMSNASTDDAYLGAYAGQGFTPAQKDGHFSLSTDEYGIFFILTSIVPSIGYVQGIDRHVLHVSKLDFYTPEFDALGNQAISAAELVVNQEGVPDTDIPSFSQMYNRPFGFTPRYAEYKTIQDKLTGDFNIRDMNTAGQASEAWHMFRIFDELNTAGDYVHNKSFVTGNTGNGVSPGQQFDRIFYNTSSSADHFTLVHTFRVSGNFPGRSLFDTYDFDDHSGETLEVEAGGVKVN